jgi:hypothetical protein
MEGVQGPEILLQMLVNLQLPQSKMLTTNRGIEKDNMKEFKECFEQ